MSATILPLPGIRVPIQRIAHFYRIGHFSHKIESLLEQGRFLPRRVVVDASALKSQSHLIAALISRGIEVVLDTNVAELSEIGRFDGLAKSAPWAQIGDGGPLRPEHFRNSHHGDLYGSIARTAVQTGVDAVLAPSHFLRFGSSDGWFDIDRQSCELLRNALDKEGGKHISVDYMFMPTYSHIRDEAVRGHIFEGLQNLPFENLWIRTTGFGANAKPAGCKRYLTSIANVHNIGKPIVADSLGGLVGLSALAFGVVSGISHGIGEHEQFNASSWNKPRKEPEDGKKKHGGRTTRILISDLGKSLTEPELRMLARENGGHRLVVCSDRNCCPHGLDDMIKNWRSHTVKQTFESISSLESIPDARRPRYFLDNQMANAARTAHQVSSLSVADSEFSGRLKGHSHRLDEMRSTLDNLYQIRGGLAPRAVPVATRTRRNNPNQTATQF